ncbi:MAG: carbohydrate binding domain-containing protein [Planctomycetia bacterium]|nr:carbohydrate binding domain-containing protein [Planctomycetia bacterium]
MRYLFSLFFLLTGISFLFGSDLPTEEGCFPFVISYDGEENASSMKHLLSAPAGKDGFIRVENGRFVNSAGPIRFNATNLTGPANFPTHEEADKLARRLARFGFNCVRLHYFDSAYGTFMFPELPGILKDSPETQRLLDDAQRDKQDYLIAALKKQGIYVDMNLHVARFWDDRDGFSGRDARPWADKGLDNFEPRMIELQKEYAKKLLTHVNPYTGNPYTDEPAIAMIEINNENALMIGYRNGMIKRLPDSYRAEFQTQWNRWLVKKYGSTGVLKKSWLEEAVPFSREQIDEGKFTRPFKADQNKWILSKEKSKIDLSAHNGSLNIAVSEKSSELFPKIFRKINIKKDQIYTLSFKIRRSKETLNKELGLAVADSFGGWRSLGVFEKIAVGTDWTPYTFSFTALDDSQNAQLQITRFNNGKYELTDLSLQCGRPAPDPIEGSLETGTIPLVENKGKYSLDQKRDFLSFINDTEYEYWTGINLYLKNELKAKPVVSGTQLGYSSPFVQAALDYVDSHSYWCHPSPVSKDWKIRNVPAVSSMSTFSGLINQRVAGKPYTVSEYNHPFPNLYGAEGQPMLRAYGRLQGWDGVFEYTYNHNPNFEPDRNTYFFSIIARTDVLAHMPACAAIYLRGDVKEAKKTASCSIDKGSYEDLLAQGGPTSYSFSTAGGNPFLGLVHRVQVDLNGPKSLNVPSEANFNEKIIKSDTGELIWNREIPGAEYWLVDTPNTKVFSGFPKDRTIAFKDLSLKVGDTKLNWATISLVSRDASGFGNKGAANILLAATGYSGNRGMKIRSITSQAIKLDDWGSGPVVNEGIPAELILPSNPEKTKVFALDEKGNRKEEVPVAKAEKGRSSFKIGAKYRTVWYEIHISE